MSVRSALVLLLALSAFTFLAACGSSGPGITKGQCPPSGCFGNSNLNGTYVFSISGTDLTTDEAPYAVVGTITANGSGGITGGTIDMNDPILSSAVIADGVTGGSYTVGADGRGKLGITYTQFTGNPFSTTLSFDFVLQDSFHGLVIENDANATGSGTLDIQTANTTPSGSYAFSFAGAPFNSPTSSFATVGNFALSGSIIAGFEDFNSGGTVLTNSGSGYPLTGTLSAEGTATTLTTGSTDFPSLTFDVFPIDASHLKFIEVDSIANLVGDALTASTSMPIGNLVFTLAGTVTGDPLAAGGIIVTNGSGGIVSGSGEDSNFNFTPSSATEPFTGSYTATTGSPGRFAVAVLSFFPSEVASFVAYPSSGGVFLLETDVGEITYGAAYAQTSGATFAASQGYGLNLSGEFSSSGESAEVDDISEFTAATSGITCNGTAINSDTLTGVTDENSTGGSTYGQALCGEYSGPDGTGRLGISYVVTGAEPTINGGVTAIAYTVDGTTFPFIEVDTAQVSTGVFFEQNASATSPSVAKAHAMFVPPALIRPHAGAQKKQTQK